MEDMLLRMVATPEIIASQIEKEVDDNKGAVGKDSFNELINSLYCIAFSKSSFIDASCINISNVFISS